MNEKLPKVELWPAAGWVWECPHCGKTNFFDEDDHEDRRRPEGKAICYCDHCGTKVKVEMETIDE